MRPQLIAFTQKGEVLAQTLAQGLSGEAIRCGEEQTLAQWTKSAFEQAPALIFVGAVGIAVRAVAPHARSKAADPAVVVVDECARFAIPLLSGHLGGANDLARRIGALCGAQPVITTATDGNGLFAVDEWARRQGCLVQNPEKIKGVSAKILAGELALLRSEWPIQGQLPEGVALTQEKDYDFLLTFKSKGKDVLRIVPRIAVVGVGCKKETSQEAIEAAFAALLAKGSVYEQAVCKICSIDLKKKEPGLVAFCKAHGFLYETFSAEQLQRARGNFSSSAFVQSVTGVDNVCERSAVLGSKGKLYLKKDAGNGVTMALALAPFAPDWRWQYEENLCGGPGPRQRSANDQRGPCCAGKSRCAVRLHRLCGFGALLLPGQRNLYHPHDPGTGPVPLGAANGGSGQNRGPFVQRRRGGIRNGRAAAAASGSVARCGGGGGGRGNGGALGRGGAGRASHARFLRDLAV